MNIFQSKWFLVLWQPRILLCLCGLAISLVFWWQLEHWLRFGIFGPDPGSYPGFYRDLPRLLMRGKIIIGLAVLCSLLFLATRVMLLFSGVTLTIIALHSVSFKFGFAYFMLGTIAYSCWLIVQDVRTVRIAKLLAHPRFVKMVIVFGVLVIVYFWFIIETSGESEDWNWSFNLVSSFLWPTSLWVGRFMALSTIVFLVANWQKPRKVVTIIVFMLLALFLEPPGYYLIPTILFANTYMLFAELLFIGLILERKGTEFR